MKITLEALKELIAANTNVRPEIKKVYIDLGTKWMEYSLIAPSTINKGFSYQMIAPMDLIKIKKGKYTIEDAQKLIDEINKRGW